MDTDQLNLPPLPEGFTIDEIPPLPDGFKIDHPARTHEQSGDNRKTYKLNPDYSVTEHYEGRGVSPYSNESLARAERLPELNPMSAIQNLRKADKGELGDAFKIALNTALIMDPNERAEAMRSQGFNVEESGGVQFVTMPGGEQFVVNKPGWSTQDAVSFAYRMAEFIPAAKIASLGKGIAGKAFRAMGAEAATSYGLEKAEQALGGYDPNMGNVALDAIIGPAGEIATPFVRYLSTKLSPQMAKRVFAEATLDDMVKRNMTRGEISAVSKELKDIMQLAKRHGIKSITSAQAVAGNTSESFSNPLARIIRFAKTNDGFARDLTRLIEEQTSTSMSRMTKMFKGIGNRGKRDALGNIRDEAQNMMDKIIEDRTEFARTMYAKAFDGVPDINAKPILDEIDSMLQTGKGGTASGTPAWNKLLEWRRQIDDSSFKGKIDPQVLQQVNWILRDLKKLPKSDTNIGAVGFRASALEQTITDTLNLATGGKRVKGRVQGGAYARADAGFARFSKAYEKLQEGMVGAAAGKHDKTLGSLIRMVFNPEPGMVAAAKDFMDQIRKSNPRAANDLYASYFHDKIRMLSVGATKQNPIRPKDILEAVYGKKGENFNMVLSLAPDNKTRRRLAEMKRLLDVSSAGSSLSDVSIMGTAKQTVLPEAGEGVLGEVGQVATPFQSLRRVLEKYSLSNRASMMFEAVMNEKWAKELDRVLALPRNSEEIAREATGFFDRMAARMAGRGPLETSIKAALPAANDRETE